MATILLAACIVLCPLVMGAMMLSMRGGKPLRKPRPGQRHPDEDDGDAR